MVMQSNLQCLRLHFMCDAWGDFSFSYTHRLTFIFADFRYNYHEMTRKQWQWLKNRRTKQKKLWITSDCLSYHAISVMWLYPIALLIQWRLNKWNSPGYYLRVQYFFIFCIVLQNIKYTHTHTNSVCYFNTQDVYLNMSAQREMIFIHFSLVLFLLNKNFFNLQISFLSLDKIERNENVVK